MGPVAPPRRDRESLHGDRGRRIGHLLDRGSEGRRRCRRRAALAALFRDPGPTGACGASRLAPAGGRRGGCRSERVRQLLHRGGRRAGSLGSKTATACGGSWSPSRDARRSTRSSARGGKNAAVPMARSRRESARRGAISTGSPARNRPPSSPPWWPMNAAGSSPAWPMNASARSPS